MDERLEQREGLRALARIIARAYLADFKREQMTTKVQGEEGNEDISISKRNSSDGKHGK